MRHSRAALLFAAAVAAALASCGDETNHYEYLDTSYIDTVFAADTIANGEVVDIEFYYPGGCNRFEKFETSEREDTLEVSVVLCFYFHGAPCVHGAGHATGSYPLVFSSEGQWYLRYRRGESEQVVQDVFVR